MPAPRPHQTTPRPWAVLATLVVLLFLGLSATAGSSALFVPAWSPPAEWLDGVPLVSSWLIPGIVLGVGFGLGSLATFIGMARRVSCPLLRWLERSTGRHWTWGATLALGIGQVVWIALEIVYLPEPSALQAIYGCVGLALASLPWVPSVRRHLMLAA